MPKRPYSTPEVLHDAPVSNLKDADFHFDDFAATLARLIASKTTETPLVIGINGAWGSGKTSLLMRTRKMLDSTKALLDPQKPALLDFANDAEAPQELFRPCRTVWFDAWKYGCEDQVLAALLRVIVAEMQRDGFWSWLKTQAQKEKEQFRWFDFLADSLVQFASAGTYTLSVGEYRVETPLKQASAFFDYFDESLTRLLATWVIGKPDKDGGLDERRGALVIFVDDLDRCLPEKTVQVLEAIKLFLDKHGCIFVLGADAEIVRLAVETHYKNIGITGDNARDYLEKVIQLRFDLPPILDAAMESYLRAQGVNEAMLNRWKALVAAAEVNPRRVKSVINDLNLQWYMALNAGQAAGVNRDDFICWQALVHAAPPAFVAQAMGLDNDAQRHNFVLDAVTWQNGVEEERKRVEGFFSAYQGARRLKSVLRQVQFSPDFTPEALNAMIHMVAPPAKPAPSGFADQKAAPEDVVASVSRRGISVEGVEMEDAAASVLHGEKGAPAGDGNLLLVGGIEFRCVPKGTFTLGSKEDDSQALDNEKPQQTLDIPYDYWLARFTVTNEQFRRFVEASGYKTTAEEQGSAWAYTGKDWQDVKGASWQHPRGPKSGIAEKTDHPVVCVSWPDARAYCQWANEAFQAELQKAGGLVLRLPFETEWEKAARGPYGNLYPWGGEAPNKSRCNFDMNIKDTTSVGAYPGGASPYGCEQMAGNVWEWVHTLHRPYPYQASDGREDEKASGVRVLRGGSFYVKARFVRCAYRGGRDPDGVGGDLGFRVVVAPHLS